MTRVGAGGTAVTKVMDRSFVEDGVRWIIDYKTTAISVPNPSLSHGVVDEATLEELAERYRPQLESYGELFAGQCIPLKIAVLFLSCGRLIVLK
jgi:ATP-dependent exoDNAse (exonuclease V) beta subunit